MKSDSIETESDCSNRDQRSVDFQFAVSPICNRLGVEYFECARPRQRSAEFNSAIRQIENLRYEKSPRRATISTERELISPFARLTPQRWILASIGIAAILFLGGIERDPSHSQSLAAHVAYALGYALTMWSLVFLTLGVFKKLCHRPNAFIRYLADSSYWMYLIHLPIVVWLQVAVAELPLHWSLKLVFISAMTIAISLLTYDLFVRSTLVGWVLNGRRRDRVIPSLVLGNLNRPWRGNRMRSRQKQTKETQRCSWCD